MNDGERGLTITELADETGVTRRTIHYYVASGLLPASGGDGRNARYGQGHVDRLRLIRELQREHLPLAEIRQRLERLTDRQVAELVRDAAAPPRTSAFEYIQSILAGTNRQAFALMATPPAVVHLSQTPEAPHERPEAPATGSPAAPVAPTTPDPPREPTGPARSQWEHIALAPDIEIHVRRPLSRTQNRAVDRLVGLARQLLEEDPQ